MIITRGFGDDQRIVTQGYGESLIRSDYPSKFTQKRIKFQFDIDICADIEVEIDNSFGLFIPLIKTSLDRVNLSVPVEKESDMEYSFMVKIDNDILRNVLKII